VSKIKNKDPKIDPAFMKNNFKKNDFLTCYNLNKENTECIADLC